MTGNTASIGVNARTGTAKGTAYASGRNVPYTTELLLTAARLKIKEMLTKKLTREEQSEILGDLFGFGFQDGILIDDDGNEFYGYTGNGIFDFSTLAGIFSYCAHRAKMQGYADAQYAIRNALGIRNF